MGQDGLGCASAAGVAVLPRLVPKLLFGNEGRIQGPPGQTGSGRFDHLCLVGGALPNSSRFGSAGAYGERFDSWAAAGRGVVGAAAAGGDSESLFFGGESLFVAPGLGFNGSGLGRGTPSGAFSAGAEGGASAGTDGLAGGGRGVGPARPPRGVWARGGGGGGGGGWLAWGRPGAAATAEIPQNT